MMNLYAIANSIAVQEYGVELERIDDEDIWQYILEKAEVTSSLESLKKYLVTVVAGKKRKHLSHVETYARNPEEAKKKVEWRRRCSYKNARVVSVKEE